MLVPCVSSKDEARFYDSESTTHIVRLRWNKFATGWPIMSAQQSSTQSYQQSTSSNCPQPSDSHDARPTNRWWNNFEVNRVTDTNPTGRLVTGAALSSSYPGWNGRIDQYPPSVPNQAQPSNWTSNSTVSQTTSQVQAPQTSTDPIIPPSHIILSAPDRHPAHLPPAPAPAPDPVPAPAPVLKRKRKTKSTPATPAPPVTTGSSSSSVVDISAGRKGNFTTAEDLQLCQSWLNVSQDPLIGNCQTMEAMWVRINADFQSGIKAHHTNQHSMADFVERNIGSLQARWQLLNKCVNKYVGYLSKCKKLNGSGKSPLDVRTDANNMYLLLEKHVFKFEQCHDFLSSAPKWTDYNLDLEIRRNPSAKPPPSSVISIRSTPAPSDFDSDIEVISSDSYNRPTGNKSAKRNRQMENALEQLANNTQILANSSASMALDSRVQSQAVDFLKDEAIMKTDTSSLEGDVKKFYETQKADIMKKQMRMMDSGV